MIPWWRGDPWTSVRTRGVCADVEWPPERALHRDEDARYARSAASTPRGPVGSSVTVTLFGHLHTPAEAWVAATRILERQALPFDRIVAHRVPLARVGEAVASIRDGRYKLDGQQAAKIVVDPWM